MKSLPHENTASTAHQKKTVTQDGYLDNIPIRWTVTSHNTVYIYLNQDHVLIAHFVPCRNTDVRDNCAIFTHIKKKRVTISAIVLACLSRFICLDQWRPVRGALNLSRGVHELVLFSLWFWWKQLWQRDGRVSGDGVNRRHPVLHVYIIFMQIHSMQSV